MVIRAAAKVDPADITGSVKKEEKRKTPKPVAPAAEAPKPDGVVVFPDQNPQSVSPSERAILERLQARRQELEQRAREIEIRESLLKSAEKRIEGRVEEAKATEAQDLDRDRAKRRSRTPPASRASSRCMRA